MDYFSILNLSKEPFSNSPDPEYFYQSRQHFGCLQKLELSLRLRRGLNVIIGDVGTGKTTLCRQLIRGFATDDNVETHLILDPYFKSSSEFLATVAEMLKGNKASSDADDWQLKEIIKQYIFRRGVDENKTVVLIIDEGQKIPVFCLEILREFLNYETNENKLLQIAIFAQREFEKVLDEYTNLADRINLYHLLEPLDFRDTRLMIRFRLKQSSAEAKTPILFSYPALWAIYNATGGYPRKIINLCHRTILTMIIQNRSKVGWFMVRSCVKRDFSEPKRKLRWVPVTALVGLLVVAITAGIALESLRIPAALKPEGLKTASVQNMEPEIKPPVSQKDTDPGESEKGVVQPAQIISDKPVEIEEPPETEQSPIVSESLEMPAELEPEVLKTASVQNKKPEIKPPAAQEDNDLVKSEKGVVQPAQIISDKQTEILESLETRQSPVIATAAESSTEMPSFEKKLPKVLGQVALRHKGTLWGLIEDVYGVFDYKYKYLKILTQANTFIKDPDYVEAGSLISVPAIPATVKPLPVEVWWVNLEEKDRLDEAINILRAYPINAPPIRIIPYWSSISGLKFAVLLREYFFDETSALAKLKKMPPSLATDGKVLSMWDKDIVFYADPFLLGQRQ